MRSTSSRRVPHRNDSTKPPDGPAAELLITVGSLGLLIVAARAAYWVFEFTRGTGPFAVAFAIVTGVAVVVAVPIAGRAVTNWFRRGPNGRRSTASSADSAVDSPTDVDSPASEPDLPPARTGSNTASDR
ncbi:hypothetical protein [Natrarchaeobius chitinivorans]|uniref:Uncharacterized protein n=1 Tax=Natrarchaeobius chitinivorans TaxID=1679083 RepID=A0A3N6PB60_NATCH|nr:hypothetical protein [Natrarchaeobius chitinivorans]RQG96449.1 hypothetical protein EA473_04835 [Natrarchaeobius chitinivorans]